VGAQGGDLQVNLAAVLQFLQWTVQCLTHKIRFSACQPETEGSGLLNRQKYIVLPVRYKLNLYMLCRRK
jgi:hypothetical protein